MSWEGREGLDGEPWDVALVIPIARPTPAPTLPPPPPLLLLLVPLPPFPPGPSSSASAIMSPQPVSESKLLRDVTSLKRREQRRSTEGSEGGSPVLQRSKGGVVREGVRLEIEALAFWMGGCSGESVGV